MSIRAPLSNSELVERLQEILDLAQSQRITTLCRQQQGCEEYWTPGTLGEAETHALTCRSLLKSQMALDCDLLYCLNEDGGAHLIACREGWALDSRCAWVIRRDALPYIFIAVGRPDGSWHPFLNRRKPA